MGGNHRGTRRVYTREEIELAIRLHDEGKVEWVDIAYRLDRSKSSLVSTVCRFRQGNWQRAQVRQRTLAMRAKLERLVVEEGVTNTKALAGLVGSYPELVTSHLRAIGFDRETMREARDAHMRRAA